MKSVAYAFAAVLTLGSAHAALAQTISCETKQETQTSTAAYPALRDRYARDATPENAAALGHAELELGMPREAAEHLSRALRDLPKDDPARDGVSRDLARAKKHIVTITIAVNRPNAAVTIDGELAGVSPISGELYLDEGTHTIRASLGKHVAAEKVVRGAMGERFDVSLALALAPIAEPPASTAAEDVRTPIKPIVIGGLVLGSATIAAGIGFAVASSTQGADTSKMTRLAGVHLGAGSAILAATLAYAFWPSAEPPRTSVALAPMKSGGAAFVAGSF